MRNPIRYKLYIITEGICLNYNGIPILFTKKQIEKFIISLSTITTTTSSFYLPKQHMKKVSTIHEHYWWECFKDATCVQYLPTIIYNNTTTLALKSLNIPLRTYTLEEFHIEPTRKSYKYLINQYSHKYICTYCRNGIKICNCVQHINIIQNTYYDFRSVIINKLC